MSLCAGIQSGFDFAEEREPAPIHFRDMRQQILKETFPKNLEDNKGYPNVDFVLLDYNSPDNMGDWVYKNFKDFVNIGKIKYYHTEEYPYYYMNNFGRDKIFIRCGPARHEYPANGAWKGLATRPEVHIGSIGGRHEEWLETS